MLSWLIEYKRPWLWTLFHVLLGYVSTFSNIVLITYFYLFLLSSIFTLIRDRFSGQTLTFLIVYLVPFEIVCRMAETSPMIPYEMGKYIQFALLLLGLISNYSKGTVGLVMLFLLLPALTFDLSRKVDFNGLIFNILSPINLCLAVIFFYKRKFTEEQLKNIFVFILLPLISALVFAFVRTPNYEEIEFRLAANFETTGGFGSNQVSTVFGLGMFLSFYLWYSRKPISGSRLFDLFILLTFVLQGLLSFSRGGMLGGALAILIFLLVTFRYKPVVKEKKFSRKKYLIPAIVAIFATILYANDVTDGKLLLRYQGETDGTFAGTREKDINTITTNRTTILEGDFNLFIEHPWGVGAGASRYLRRMENGVVSHLELGRLISEHGYLGFIFFIILTFIPLYFFKFSSGSLTGFILFSLFFVAWYTTFHAATRNFVAPLLIGLSLISINNKSNLSNNAARI